MSLTEATGNWPGSRVPAPRPLDDVEVDLIGVGGGAKVGPNVVARHGDGGAESVGSGERFDHRRREAEVILDRQGPGEWSSPWSGSNAVAQRPEIGDVTSR